MQKITPFLWFDNQAEEAVKFYCSVFPHAKIGSLTPFVSTFELEGLQFTALNGGPQFRFSEAISLYVNCETQEEVDRYWEKLSDGGQVQQCGWLKDRFGVSWQIIPCPATFDERSRPRQGEPGDAGDDADEEDRHRRPRTRLRRLRALQSAEPRFTPALMKTRNGVVPLALPSAERHLPLLHSTPPWTSLASNSMML